MPPAPAGPPRRLAGASPEVIGPTAGSVPNGDVWVALPEVTLRPDNVPLRSRVRLIDLAANGRVRSTTLPLPVPGMPCVAVAAGRRGGLLVAGGRGVVHSVATDVLVLPLDRAMRPAGPGVAMSHLAPGAFACGPNAAPRDDGTFEVGMTTWVRSVGAPTSTLLTLRRVSTLGRPLGAPVEVSDALAAVCASPARTGYQRQLRARPVNRAAGACLGRAASERPFHR